ncbi:hypothetical protein [Aureisphaera sp.]
MSHTSEIKELIKDYFHSGKIYRMNLEEVVTLCEHLDNLLHLVDGVEIELGMTPKEIRDMLGDPILEVDNSWFYPSVFESNHYRIRFNKDLVEKTDFVTLKIT